MDGLGLFDSILDLYAPLLLLLFFWFIGGESRVLILRFRFTS